MFDAPVAVDRATPVTIKRSTPSWHSEPRFAARTAASNHAIGEMLRVQAKIKPPTAGGKALPDSVRAFFQGRYEYDFSPVRVHADSAAADMAERADALAFTYGHHIVFGAGQYAPDHAAGRALLAHELAHVVQQRAVQSASEPAAPEQPTVQRAEPVTTITLGAVVARCIIGAIVGALLDAGIQAALNAWHRGSWRFWEGLRLNYCSIILSAVLGCFAAPISAYVLSPWISARLGARLGAMAGSLLGRILIFIAQRVGIAVPKVIVGKLLKLGCVSEEQALELGVSPSSVA